MAFAKSVSENYHVVLALVLHNGFAREVFLSGLSHWMGNTRGSNGVKETGSWLHKPSTAQEGVSSHR